MQVNSTSINLSNINNLQNSSLEKIATGLSINSAADNSSTLSIATMLEAQRSTMHQALGNINSGIAMGNIAQSGLNEQKDILNNINTLTIQAMSGTTSDEGKEAIKNQISGYLDQFDTIAQQTSYGDKNLLADNSQNLSITTSDNVSIDMKSVDTTKVSQTLRDSLDNFTTDTNAMSSVITAAQNGMDQLAQYASSYAASSNQMASSGRNILSAETNMSQAASRLKDIDYGKEITGFSKSNLMAQIGMLASTQANAIQQRNVSLLS